LNAQESVGSVSTAAARFFASIQRTSTEDLLRKELQSAARKERERLERLGRRLEDDLRRGEDVEQWKIAGELLAANLYRVERGSTSVEVPNYYDPEQRPLRIELDAELTPQENVERLFRRYRKGTDAALQAMEQSESVGKRLADARAWEARIADTPLEGLPVLREELSRTGLLQSGSGRPGEKLSAGSGGRPAVPEYPPGVRIRRYLVDGWEVLLGENSTSNDYLTTRVARPDDWWLHVRASPSAHVVVRAGGHPERVPHHVLQEAARITAAHSESKHSSYVPVDYVLRKFVRKPRGSAPGLVTYRGEKTLSVEPARQPAPR
jgi:predicted ribosome quality control (RQC) complex YloA/Tae2 family protein